jgi:TonB family protein
MTFISRRLRKLICVLHATSLGFASTVFAQEPRGESPQTPKIIRKSGGVLQGSATKRAEPTYPPLAKAAQVSGSVVVEVTVDEEGTVIAARPISGHALLKDAAVSAARKWTFTPTTLQGVPVKVIGTITFNFELGDDPAGIKSLEKEVATSPNSPELVRRLGLAYLGVVQVEKAVEEFKRAVELKPDFAEAHNDLGWAYHELGRDDEAIESANAVLKIDPESKSAVNAHLLIGFILFQRDRIQESIARFKLVLKIHSGLPDSDSDGAHAGLAYAYIKAGDKKSALAEYEILKVRDSDSNGPGLSELLKRLIDAMR